MASALAALALMVNAFVWGVSWWPFRALNELGVHPLWATAFLYLVALVCLFVVRPAVWRTFVRFPALWLLFLTAGCTNLGFNWAVTTGDVVRVVLLFYLMPAWVVLLAWPLLGEKPTAGSLARLALAMLGVVVVLKSPTTAWPWPESTADWLALMGGLAFALTNIMLRKLRGAPPAATVLAMFGGAAGMAALAALLGMQQGLVAAPPAPAWNWLVWVAVLGMAFLAGNLGLQYGAARLSANTTSLIMLSEVVFASASSVLLGASELSPRTVLGGSLILLAALLSAVSLGRKPGSPVASA